jgi:hypothetical protein
MWSWHRPGTPPSNPSYLEWPGLQRAALSEASGQRANARDSSQSIRPGSAGSAFRSALRGSADALRQHTAVPTPSWRAKQTAISPAPRRSPRGAHGRKRARGVRRRARHGGLGLSGSELPGSACGLAMVEFRQGVQQRRCGRQRATCSRALVERATRWFGLRAPSRESWAPRRPLSAREVGHRPTARRELERMAIVFL